MSELNLNPWQSTDYGRRADGVVETGQQPIKVTARQPHEMDKSIAYVLAPGLGVDKASMRVPALAIVEAGYTAITLSYNNTGADEPLEHNAQNIADAIDSLEEPEIVRYVGLSEAGGLGPMALRLTESPVHSATFVAPAMFGREQCSNWEVAKHFAIEGVEGAKMWRNPKHAAYITLSALGNCVGRRQAVLAELKALPNGSVHDAVREVAERPNPPNLRAIIMENDKLIPAWLQISGSEELQDVLEIWQYPGGHADLAHRPEPMKDIIVADDNLSVRQALDKAA
jgi:hypothetical protein